MAPFRVMMVHRVSQATPENLVVLVEKVGLNIIAHTHQKNILINTNE